MQATASLPQLQSSSGSAIGAGLQKTGAATEQTGIDFQNFLQLLTAQLRNQDPLSPLDSTEFVAQLASFSSVEQLVNVNQRLDAIATSIVSDGIEKYAGWIGRDAEVNAGQAFFDGSPIRYRLSGDAAATRVDAVFTDAAGIEVARMSVQNSNTEQQWDGTAGGATVPEGYYNVTAIYYDGDDIIDTEAANTFAVVSEIRFTNDGAVLGLRGGAEIDPSQIVGLGEQR